MSDLKAAYLTFYHKADAILKQPDNPCQIQMLNGLATCVISRRATSTSFPAGTLCCTGCKHLSLTGCTVESLWCKLGWCYGAADSISGMAVSSHPTFIALSALRQEAYALGIPMRSRASVDENFPVLRTALRRNDA